MRHDFLFSSKSPVLVCSCPKNIFFSAVKFELLSKSVIKKTCFDKYKKTKNVCQNPCCVGSLLQYIIKKTQTKRASFLSVLFPFFIFIVPNMALYVSVNRNSLPACRTRSILQYKLYTQVFS